jgi:hypothetical protein
VRASTNAVCLFIPLSPTRTRIIYAADVDIRGWVPRYAVELAGDELPIAIKHLADYAKTE